MQAQRLPRVFKIGAARIEDTTPELSLYDAIRVLSKHYPQLRHTKVYEEDARVDNGELVYEVQLPPAKTNG